MTEFVTRGRESGTLSERTKVLVWLLVRLRETAREALETFPITGDGETETGETSDDDDTTTEIPPWLRLWDESKPGTDGTTTTDDTTGPRSVLVATLAENPHLDGVDASDVTVTDREIDTVTQDRDPLYAEAAALAQKFRRLDGSLADAGREAIADLFKIEAFQPDPTESHEGSTVFELYWALQLLDTFPSEHLSRFHMDGDEVLSRWTEGDLEYVLCHDTDGAVEIAGTELEIVDFVATRHWDETDIAEPESRRGFLRDHYLDLAAATDLDRDYGEKEPDLLVFEFDADADDWVLRRLFIGEVKFSTKLGTVRSGLQELVEYAGFARLGPDAQRPDGGTDGAPVADSDFLGGRIELGLFVGRDWRVDEVDRDDMQASGWGGSVERPLE